MIAVEKLLPLAEAKRVYDDTKLLESLTEDEQRLVLATVYYHDIDLFAHEVTLRWCTDQATQEEIESADFHLEMDAQESLKEDSLYIVSRDHAKTTRRTKIKVLHELIYGVEKSILLIMSKGLGESVIGDIRKELETNSRLRWIYGTLVPIDNKKDYRTQKWRDTELQLVNGTEVKTLTKGQPVRGQRPTKIIIDDPQEKKDVKNPQMVEEFWHWVWTSLYPTLDPHGSMTVLATLISANCFAAQLKGEAEERGFKVIEYPAILNFNQKKIRKGTKDGKPWWFFDEGIGTPLWPQKWSIEYLEKRYNKIGKKAFLQEYQNIPYVINGRPVFDKDYVYTIMKEINVMHGFRIFRDIKEIRRCAFVGMDFAKGRTSGDYNTAVIRDEEYRLIAEYRGHDSQKTVAKLLNDILAYFEDYYIVPENNYGLEFLLAAESYDFYDKMYRQKRMDTVTKKESEVLGFNTNAKTKPMIISDLDDKFKEGNFEVSEQEKIEIDNYYNDENGGMAAIHPHHDDLVIGDSLAVQAVKNGLVGPQLIVF